MVEQIGEDLYGIESELRMPLGPRFPLRMTVLRLRSGGLLLHSPVALDASMRAAVEALGEVRYIVAPNALHHLHLPAAAEHFPSARIFVSPLVRTKQAGLRIHGTLDEPSLPFADELDVLPIDGAPSVGEFVLFHRASRTLLVTDLAFHICTAKGVPSQAFFRLVGVFGRFRQSRLFKLVIRDRDAYGRSVARVLALPIERVIPCHGPAVSKDARARLAAALDVPLPLSGA